MNVTELLPKQMYYFSKKDSTRDRPRGYKIISCSTQLSMKFFLLIKVKMPTTALKFKNRKNKILGLSEPEKS